MESAGDSLRNYYHRKKCLHVYRLRTATTSPEDRWRRVFLTFFFSLLTSGLLTALSRGFHFPEFLALPLSFASLVLAVEGADRVWLDRFKIANPSDLEVLGGLSFVELRVIEDSLLLTREKFIGAKVWRGIGRHAREGVRLTLHYWPVTLALVLVVI